MLPSTLSHAIVRFVAEAPKPRILVVDDNETNRLLVVETLAPDGMEVVEASSGAEAIACFERGGFDLVLLDVRMPGLDGFATLERVRALPGGADVPVVFLTALRDLDTFDRAHAAGAVDFLNKPVRPSELSSRVETLLQVRRLGVELRSHVEAVRKQRDDLMRVQLQKERLAAFIVHDLKNPLSAMRLHASVIARTPDVPAAAREAAGAIREQVDRLNHLVMNLLDVSKADEGKLVAKRETVPLAALAEDVRSELAVQADARRVSVESAIAHELTVPGDRDLLRRVLENLVDNALRHTPAGGRVHIDAERTAAVVRLRVCDTGSGVPTDLVERIFDPFVQVEGAKSATRSGRGLGLAFCKAAVLAHGGTITVENRDLGACFVITLPDDAAREGGTP